MDYKEINRKAWNQRTAVHVDSEFYDNKKFIEGQSSLNSIELELLKNVEGKSILHLQSHFGQDTISLSRLGARTTGVDLSDKAIDQAKELASKTNTDAQFICCEIYDLPQHLDEQFDIVYTSYGTIGWLPDLDKWAKVISNSLKPGGQFIFVEFHPVVWMFDDDFEKVGYNYFNSGPITDTTAGTYAKKDTSLSFESVTWNHGMGEVVSSLLRNDLEINVLNEYDYSPYDCFRHTLKIADRKYRIKHLENKIPMVYSIVATKSIP